LVVYELLSAAKVHKTPVTITYRKQLLTATTRIIAQTGKYIKN